MAFDVKIGTTNYDFFNKITIRSKFGHIASGFNLTALYENENPVHRRIFRPLSYNPIQINSERGERLITGTILNNKFLTDKTQRKASASGYSTCGIVQDCSIPLSAYPLQFNGLTIRQIAERLLTPFGLTISIVNDGGIADQVIDEVTASPSDSVSQFLTNIVAQRNLVLTNNEFGQLQITRPNLNQAPIATYREETPATSIELTVNGQALHSSITAMKQIDIEGDNVAESTVENPTIPIFRPLIKLQNVGNDNQTEDAARNIRANELRAIRLKITSDRITWLNGNRANAVETIRPNNIISVISPENYIYNRTSFFVEQVELTIDDKKEIAVLNCVLPEVYSNQTPKFSF